MKANHFFSTTLIAVLFSTVTFAQSGLQKTLITSVLPGESNMVFFDLPGEVEVEVWDRNYIKVEIDIQTNLKNEEVFNYLNESGRYQVTKGYNSYYFLIINLGNIKEEVSVNQIALEESFKFKVTVPWDVDIDPGYNNDLTVGYNSDKEEGNDLLVNQIKQ